MASQEFMDSYFSYVESNVELYKERLGEAVAIPSVSSQLDEHLGDIVSMMEWTKSHIERLKGRAMLQPNPLSTSERPLPPILMADFRVDPKKLTLCVYGHLDVQPAAKEDGWDSDPFTLTERNGQLFGRGSTDDKGPALSWLWVIEAHQALGVDLPVNIKLLFEGMEESGSEGIFETIVAESRSHKFLDDVDFFTISDNYWIGKKKPCLTYGLRGIAYFQVSVQCSEQDLHSGVLGGTMHEGMTDLVHLMSSMIDSQGKILIDGIMDDVAPVTPEEEALYKDIDFNLKDYKDECKIKSVSNKLLYDNKKDLLMARWRFPTLSLHGIEGAFSGKGAKTVIPATSIGKFSMRLVPDQDPKKIEEAVVKHLTAKMKEIGSPNKMEVSMIHGAKAWFTDPKHPNYEAASRAVMKVYNDKPDYTREGGSIPIAGAFEDATGMNVLLIPVGSCDDMAHSQNEKFNISNLVNAIKVLGIYLHELSTIEGPKPSMCRCVPLTPEELMVPGAFMKGFKCKCEI